MMCKMCGGGGYPGIVLHTSWPKTQSECAQQEAKLGKGAAKLVQVRNKSFTIEGGAI